MRICMLSRRTLFFCRNMQSGVLEIFPKFLKCRKIQTLSSDEYTRGTNLSDLELRKI